MRDDVIVLGALRGGVPVAFEVHPLNKQGETIDSLYRTGRREELKEGVTA